MRRVLDTHLPYDGAYMVWRNVWFDMHDHVDLSEEDSNQVYYDAEGVGHALACLGWCLRDVGMAAACEARGVKRGYAPGFDDGYQVALAFDGT